MRYLSFTIKNYRAIEGPLKIDFSKRSLVPLVGINECGKTTILQAIYCFDYVNDKENDSKHLEFTKNLYQTKEKGDPIVECRIAIKLVELKALYKDFREENAENISESTGETGKDIFNSLGTTDELVIERNLNSKKYKILNVLDEVPENELFAKKVVQNMPYILYNDDFMERPPNFIEIPVKEPESLTGWLAIFERLFNLTSSDYSLFKIITETDSRRRDAIISDVQDKLNKTLTKAWKAFSLASHGGLEIRLRIENNASKHILDIKIVERIKEKERYFDVIDRSKGFLWFFNFVMKLEFNPKVTNYTSDNTIYLLDEPGSYLHYSAQAKLCKKLLSISKEHGTVLYCTHSHTLLNPEVIPLNNIYIVEKDKTKKIKALPISKVETVAENINAFQPIHEALQISAFEFERLDSNYVIAVEGIYDKYAIEIMLSREGENILPGTGANSLIKNIQFLNGYNKIYIAIWDNDDEGNKRYKEACKFFGEFESHKFDFLPKMNKNKRRMEDMFEDGDFEVMKRHLHFEGNINYEKLISMLRYSSKSVRDRVISDFANGTKERFKILNGIIEKRFEIAKKMVEQLN